LRVVTSFVALALLGGGLLQRVRPLTLPLFNDGHYYFLQMFSLLVDGDLDFANQYAALGDPFHNAHYEVTRGIGNALLGAPFFYLGRIAAVLRDIRSRPVARRSAGCYGVAAARRSSMRCAASH
jgi:hypothetical protein